VALAVWLGVVTGLVEGPLLLALQHLHWLAWSMQAWFVSWEIRARLPRQSISKWELCELSCVRIAFGPESSPTCGFSVPEKTRKARY
jgi:hypothetical protein